MIHISPVIEFKKNGERTGKRSRNGKEEFPFLKKKEKRAG